MDAFSSFFQSQSASWSSWSYDSLKNFRQISPAVQTHLQKVYLTLCCALIASALGAYLHILWNIGGFLTTLGFIGIIVWIFATPLFEEQKRVALLMVGAVFEGASIGPFIDLADLAIKIDPSIVISTFVGTAVAFGCFSMAAMLARRRENLYLGGLLSSGCCILFWLHLASYIFGVPISFFMFEIYFWLLLFVGYTVVDTQKIIEEAHSGDMDYVKHALTLFMDFVAFFVRILVIVTKNSREREEEKKKKSC